MEEKTFTVSYLGVEYPVLYITELATALEALAKLDSMDVLFGLDTETCCKPNYSKISTAALSPHYGKIRLLQLFTGRSVAVFDCLTLYDLEFIHAVRNFLSTHKFVAHNAIFDLQFLIQMFGCNTSSTRIDIACTYIMWKIITHATRPTDEGIQASLGVLSEKTIKNSLCLKVLQASEWAIPDLTFEQIQYSSIDSIAVRKLADKILPTIKALGCETYYNLCEAAQHPIAEMQLNGIQFNSENHLKLVDEWRYELYAAKKELTKITGLDKITSHTIATYLEQHLDKELLALWPRTEAGKLQTDSHTLQDYALHTDVVTPFATYQKKEKLTTSFGMQLIDAVNTVTKRLHASYNICGARTGRLSCRKPNLQQLPRDEAVRSNFIAADKTVLLCADYSQIELRVGAELSRDESMLSAYRQGIDLHSLTASIISKTPITKVSKVDRQKAKAFNFGLMFGLGPTKFSKYAKQSYKVDITSKEAQDSIDLWRLTYSGYRAWQLEQADNAAMTGFAYTALGKRRCLDPENCYGASMNTPVQGSASECMLAALVYLHSNLKRKKLKAKLCNCIHDEIIVECPVQEVKKVKALIKESMKEGFLFVFPSGITNGLCEVGEGINWSTSKNG